MSDDLTRAVLVVVGVLVAVPVVMMVLFMPFGMMGGGGAWHDGMMWGSGWSGGMAIAWLVTVLLLAGGGYLLYSRSDSTDKAIEELRVAYARGDISEEEFEKRRENLKREED
ncbi:SHOCT domain-containing protein [Haladaptatus sp. F3-133]|uniref:SHOCT domain-containing protein n=1 Tax=Halorutilus salinus TaxID=2487751 RepID=A0A9Q4C5V2_9EURY|nr:SHOCT domain-containing protein [Halorutilus salinus]MCX2819823.1 SHOCT domain-containing protein [Halorutilus salinus]